MSMIDKAMKAAIGNSAKDLAAVLNEIHGYLEEQVSIQREILKEIKNGKEKDTELPESSP